MSRDGRILLLASAAAVAAGCAVPMREDAALRGGLGGPLSPAAAPQDQAALDQAVALAAELHYDEAAGKLEALLPRLGTPGNKARLAEGTFWLGFCREKQGRAPEAGELYGRVMRMLPDSPAGRLARQRLARLPLGPPR
jgi:TolA-binding protein